MMGAENTTKIIPEEEKRITAFHEAGHALVAMLLENEGADPVHKATIVPRGSGVMGLVQQQPTKDKYSSSRKQMLTRLRVCLAGRAAEELLLGNEDVTSGAMSDFQQATSLAKNMVRRLGFNTSLGTIDYETADTSEGAFMSDVTKQKIEHEVRTVVEQAYSSARDMLLEHRDALDKIAANLLKYETLTGEQLKALIEGKEFIPPAPRPQPPSWSNEKGKGGSGNLPQVVPTASPEAGEKHGKEIKVVTGIGTKKPAPATPRSSNENL